MPLTTIEVRTTYTQQQESAIIEAVQSALIEGFKIPLDDRNISLVVHSPHRMIVSPALAQPERRTVVSMDVFPGRSLDAKRALYKAIVVRVEPLGIPRDHVSICLREIPFDNWGLRGGQAASDVHLGFNVNV
jgi:phenylpyruvate tautomerase PptA (4-oxalocrotonate tautomerase family)